MPENSQFLPTVNRAEVLRRALVAERDERDGTRMAQAESDDPVRYDATGRMIRTWDKKAEKDSSLLSGAEERKKAILGRGKADFTVRINPEARGEKPLHALDAFSEVRENEATIEREARKAGIDPDLVKSIVHLETTHGYYDRIFTPFGVNRSIRPMNIQAEYWKELGYSREELESPEKNIQAGVELLKRIQVRMPNASIAQKATIYNSLGAKKVTDYGMRVEKLYSEKPWRHP